MDSAMIGKIEKAKRYAEEPERVRITAMTVMFRGEHGTYQVTYDHGQWQCGCRFFAQRKVCSHTMALERMFGDQLAGPSEPAQESQR